MPAGTLTEQITVPNLRQSTDFWDLSQRSLTAQRAGRYVPDRPDDPPSLKAGRTWPDVAGAIIDTYSEPGDMIFDPMCGVGTVLVEAVYRGRPAIGLELEEVRLARAADNILWAIERGAIFDTDAFRQDARELYTGFGTEFAPKLIVIDPPFSETRMDGGPSRFNSPLHNYTGEDRIKGRGQRDPSNLGNLKHADYLVQMRIVYANCLAVAAEGAYMAVVIKDYRKAFRRIDLLGDTRRICEEAGWRYYDRATLYLGTASHQQRRNAAANHHLLPVTQDLLVFKKGR